MKSTEFADEVLWWVEWIKNILKSDDVLLKHINDIPTIKTVENITADNLDDVAKMLIDNPSAWWRFVAQLNKLWPKYKTIAKSIESKIRYWADLKAWNTFEENFSTIIWLSYDRR